MLASTVAVSERTLQAAFVLTTIMRRPRWCRQAQRLRPSAGSPAWRGSTDRGWSGASARATITIAFLDRPTRFGRRREDLEGSMIPLVGGLGLAPRAITP